MAFALQNLEVIGHANGWHGWWSYVTPDDDDVLAPGYFDGGAEILGGGDLIVAATGRRNAQFEAATFATRGCLLFVAHVIRPNRARKAEFVQPDAVGRVVVTPFVAARAPVMIEVRE